MARKKKRRWLKTTEAEVLGIEEVKSLFDSLARDLQRAVVADALQAAARVVLAEEQRHVPIRTGTLRDSLQIFKVRHAKKASRLAVGAGPEGFYGRFIEYGYHDRGGTWHPGTPWLRPALDAAFSSAVASFRTEFVADLDPVVEDLARRTGAL